MDMKTIENFETTRDFAEGKKAIVARVEGGQAMQTPAPFIRRTPAVAIETGKFA